MCTTEREYGATVTELALPDALVMLVALLARVYTVGVPDGVNPLSLRLTV
jgi:hypothetical protein